VVVNKETAKIFEEALAQLPEKYRLVFVLREIDYLSIAETMEVLEISESNVNCEARISAVSPSHLFAFTFAPLSISHFTIV
jgi:DNA-directed RNA polymerase specialized sigma subunit